MNDIHETQRIRRLLHDVYAYTQQHGVPPPDAPPHTLRDIFALNEAACIDCEACMDSLCCLVETVLNGGDLHMLLPTFAEHIGECASCQEEYDALLCILEAERGGHTSTDAAPTASS